VGVVFWIASFVCLLAMNVTVRQSEQPTLVLLFCFGFLVGLAMADHGLHHPGAAPAGPCPGGAVRARELLLGARSNPFLLVAVLGAVAVQLAILYLPALQRLFATQALSPFQLALVLVASTAAFVAVELEKWILRRQSRRSRQIRA
jgi:magnesium-transporting ATPase (P-type)